MSKHRRPSSAKKVTPTVILIFAVLSIGTPLLSLIGSIQDLALAVSPTTDTHQLPAIPPSSLSLSPSPPSTRPAGPPSSSSAPPRPHTAQRPVQSAPSSPQKAVQQPSRTPEPPAPKTRVITKTLPPPAPKTITDTETTTATATKTVTKTETETVTKPAQAQAHPRSHAQLVDVAQKYVGRGIPYVLGGNDLAKGMDCSHFVWMVLKEVGYTTPYRNSESLIKWTKHVTQPQLGDLVLYHGHVGIYAGNGMMVNHGKDGGAFLSPVYKDDTFVGYGRIPL